MFKRIFRAMHRGWVCGGIKWREEFYDFKVDPIQFTKMTGFTTVLKHYLCLSKSEKAIFLNMIYRKYENLRLDRKH